MSQDNRRKSQRLEFKVPVKHRPTEGSTPFLSSAESVNLSDEGLLFVTDASVGVDSLIDLTYTMPREMTGTQPMKIRCTARVIRIDRNGLPEGKAGIACHIERFETIVAEV